LIEAGRRPVLFYSNSNIATAAEFERRLESVRRLSAIYGLVLEVDPYNHAAWLAAVAAGLEHEPERGLRCHGCFAWSLGRAAGFAERRGLNFTTTLTVSPHKCSATLFEVGGRYTNFEEWDFKKKDGFRQGRELAKQYGFYLQNFCGCEFSMRV